MERKGGGEVSLFFLKGGRQIKEGSSIKKGKEKAISIQRGERSRNQRGKKKQWTGRVRWVLLLSTFKRDKLAL